MDFEEISWNAKEVKKSVLSQKNNLINMLD